MTRPDVPAHPSHSPGNESAPAARPGGRKPFVPPVVREVGELQKLTRQFGGTL